jgi:hypothetical protein
VKTEDDTQDDPWCLFWPSCDASRFQSLGSLIALWIGVSPSLLVYQISLSRLLARSGMGLMTQQGQRFRLRLFFDSGTETNHYMAIGPLGSLLFYWLPRNLLRHSSFCKADLQKEKGEINGKLIIRQIRSLFWDLRLATCETLSGPVIPPLLQDYSPSCDTWNLTSADVLVYSASRCRQ